MKDFLAGFSFWLRGWQYLLHRRSLLVVAMAPLAIAVVATVTFIWLLWSYLPVWVQGLIHLLLGVATGFWYSLLYYPLVFGGGVLIFVATIYVVYVFQALIAVPFYSALAEKTLLETGKKQSRPEVWNRWMRRTLSMLKASVIKALLFLSIGIVLFVFSFLPILNIVAIAGTMMIFAFDCMDYSFDAMGYGLRRRLSYLVRNRMQWFGMAAALALTLLLPGLTLLVIPGAVVGSALIMKDGAHDSRAFAS